VLCAPISGLAITVSEKVSVLCTDQWVGYRGLGKEYPHGVVDHAKGQYVNGVIHTQTIEGFWSIIKRGIVGTYHRISTKYMPLYAAEFRFRYIAYTALYIGDRAALRSIIWSLATISVIWMFVLGT
jgi:hypothetical protein